MNNYLLFFTLFIGLLILIKIRQFDFACPEILFIAGFVLSALFLALNTNRWEYEIQSFTVLVILISVIMFSLGCRLGNLIVFSKMKKIRITGLRLTSRYINAIIIILCIGCCAIRLLDVYERTGTINVFLGAIRLYRYADVKSRLNSLIKLTTGVITAAIIYEIIYLIDSFFMGKKKRSTAIITIIFGVIYYALSSSRIEIIYIIIYVAIAYFFSLRHYNRRIGGKAFTFGFLFIVAMFGVFYAAGYLTGKSQIQTSLFDNISLYAGSSIGALDVWIKGFHYTNEYQGSVIFSGLKNFLSLFGITMNTISDPRITFINLGRMAHTTNVFTCLAELISDVNYVYAYIIIFIEGVISQMIYKQSKKSYSEGKGTTFYLYLYLAPLIAMSSISERFFSTFLTLSTLLFLVLIKVLKTMELDYTRKE